MQTLLNLFINSDNVRIIVYFLHRQSCPALLVLVIYRLFCISCIDSQVIYE